MRWLVVGAGSIGLQHLRLLRDAGEHQVYALDPDPAARERAVPFTGKKGAVASWDDAPSFDAVVIATPTHRHQEDALIALTASPRLVAIEKPVSHRMEGGDALVAVVNGKPTVVACPMRFHPDLVALKQRVEQGRLGPIVDVTAWYRQAMHEWRPERDYRTVYSASREQGGGLFFDRIHELDYLRWMLGDPGQVRGAVTGVIEGTDVEALAYGLQSHEGGIFSRVILDAVTPGYLCGCQVIGHRATEDFNAEPRWAEAMAGQTKHWIAVAHGFEEPCQNVAQAFRVLQTAAALYISAEQGGWVAIRNEAKVPEPKA